MATSNRIPFYNLAEWATNTTLGRRVFNYNFRMTGSEIRGWELVNTVDMAHEPNVTERVYIWERHDSGGKALIRVDIAETNEWRRAQSELQAQLLHSMRPEIQRAEGKQAVIGDIGFATRSDDTHVTASFLFSRGNITVSVASAGEEIVDVSAIAQNLDHRFAEPPKPADLESRRAEKHPSSKPLFMKTGEPASVIDRLPEPTLQHGWLKVIAPDGELTRDGDALIYVSPDSGSKSLEAFVVIQQ